MKIRILLYLIFFIPQISHGVLVATLEGHESDVCASGSIQGGRCVSQGSSQDRPVHIVVAGYGGEMKEWTYAVAVTKAKKLKRDFPNERVIIIGSTPSKEGTEMYKPSELAKKFDISLPYRKISAPADYNYDEAKPLTGSNLAGTVMYLTTSPEERGQYGQSSQKLKDAIDRGDVPLRGRVKSLDFISHSTPLEGMLLHDTESFTFPGQSQATSLSGQRNLTADSKNFKLLNGLFTPDAYVNVAGCSGGYGLTDDLSKTLGVPVSGSANSSSIYVMEKNGNFHYNYGASNPHSDLPLTDDIKNNKTNHELAPGENIPVVALRPSLGPYVGYWGRLSSGSNFPITSCSIDTENSGDNVKAFEDRKRCLMGMARSVEDTLTETSSQKKPENLTFSEEFERFSKIVKEKMCPSGFAEGKGYSGTDQKTYVASMADLKDKCNKAIKNLYDLNMECRGGQGPHFIPNLFDGKIEGRRTSELSADCRAKANEFIKDQRYFVPFTDTGGKKTLFADIDNGTAVTLKNCEVTPEEEKECSTSVVETHASHLSPSFKSCLENNKVLDCFYSKFGSDYKNSSDYFSEAYKDRNSTYYKYKKCLNYKRCEIDEENSKASNQNNPTFMKYVQNYFDGFLHLHDYRKGGYVFKTKAPKSTPSQKLYKYSPAAERAIESGAVGLF